MPTEPTTVARSTTPAGAEVATLTFDHGPLNLFDQAMFDSLSARVEELAANPPRALLLRAEGKVNSAGVDVHVFKGLTAQRGAELWRGLFANIIDPLEALPCPVVFAAHGLTLTAAFEIALACDIILAAPRAKFGLDVDAAARALTDRLADGPTKAHAATKEIIAAWRSGGVRHADSVTPAVSGALFATDDLQRAVVSFLEVGPGKATYGGR